VIWATVGPLSHVMIWVALSAWVAVATAFVARLARGFAMPQ
jgi:hypothetical protein